VRAWKRRRDVTLSLSLLRSSLRREAKPATVKSFILSFDRWFIIVSIRRARNRLSCENWRPMGVKTVKILSNLVHLASPIISFLLLVPHHSPFFLSFNFTVSFPCSHDLQFLPSVLTQNLLTLPSLPRLTLANVHRSFPQIPCSHRSFITFL
jgi:hypothetical protein